MFMFMQIYFLYIVYNNKNKSIRKYVVGEHYFQSNFVINSRIY